MKLISTKSSTMRLLHKFVKKIPETLEDGTIYVSMTYGTAIHKCCCGCGREVVTPFSPTDWKLIFDGKTISLRPSIGNWNFECQSHYWITNNTVQWAPKWTQEEIKRGRAKDAMNKKAYYNKAGQSTKLPPKTIR
jgi:hypothetical protein